MNEFITKEVEELSEDTMNMEIEKKNELKLDAMDILKKVFVRTLDEEM